MLSRLVLRKPTLDQTWNRVRRDRQTGIPGRLTVLTKAPTREELETWAIQAGYDPIRYLTAWVCQAEETCRLSSLEPSEGLPSGRVTPHHLEERKGSCPKEALTVIAHLLQHLPKWSRP
ncbi:MAG TPA: hypothetical protein VH540_00300 [Ktedonobacterales bacterium]|jgi:hypothetical protein